ncbi:MAG: hypothetical protein IJ796_10445 [Lachnospiraceae bacterium]|nr:hypothetical protein [Lachnospiraceae bacterium]
MKVLGYVKDGNLHLALEKCGMWAPVRGGRSVMEGAGLVKPWIGRTKQGTFAVIAVRDQEEGKPGLGRAVLYRSGDLIEFEEIGSVWLADEPIAAVRITFGNEIGADRYFIQWQGMDGGWHQASVSSIDKRVLSTSEIVSTTITEYGLIPSGDIEKIGGIDGEPVNILELSDTEYERLSREV